ATAARARAGATRRARSAAARTRTRTARRSRTAVVRARAGTTPGARTTATRAGAARAARSTPGPRARPRTTRAAATARTPAAVIGNRILIHCGFGIWRTQIVLKHAIVLRLRQFDHLAADPHSAAGIGVARDGIAAALRQGRFGKDIRPRET